MRIFSYVPSKSMDVALPHVAQNFQLNSSSVESEREPLLKLQKSWVVFWKSQ